MLKKVRNILGGPERRAFGKENVKPTSFSNSDPFWDIGALCNDLDEYCRSGRVKDLIIISRTENGVRYTWRGCSPMTTILGMMDYAKHMILGETR